MVLIQQAQPATNNSVESSASEPNRHAKPEQVRRYFVASALHQYGTYTFTHTHTHTHTYTHTRTHAHTPHIYTHTTNTHTHITHTTHTYPTYSRKHTDTDHRHSHTQTHMHTYVQQHRPSNEPISSGMSVPTCRSWDRIILSTSSYSQWKA